MSPLVNSFLRLSLQLVLFLLDKLRQFLLILRELREVLREDFGWSEEKVTDTIRLIEIQTSKVNPKIRLSTIKGKDSDNRILECALEGKVQ